MTSERGPNPLAEVAQVRARRYRVSAKVPPSTPNAAGGVRTECGQEAMLTQTRPRADASLRYRPPDGTSTQTTFHTFPSLRDPTTDTAFRQEYPQIANT
jgi:hypothetical protein